MSIAVPIDSDQSRATGQNAPDSSQHPSQSPAEKISVEQAQQKAKLRRIVEHCAEFQSVDLKRSIAQVVLSLGLFGGVIAAMIVSAQAGLWWVLALLSPIGAGLLVKLFIIQHDCGHGSFFENKRANHALGFAISLLTFTPYGFWRDAHNRHHASSGDLDRRGIGGVDTLTVEEYHALSTKNRFLYRFYRHPAVLIFFGSPIYFMIMQRFPMASAMPFTETYQGLKLSQIWKSVALLNVALVVFYGALSMIFGLGIIAAVVIPVVSLSAWIGSWLFFVQHQYEDTYWAARPDWNYAEAAIYGSSHYKLPTPLRWITGNIGLHHIHHLASRIPNYRLMECYRASEDLLSLPVMTIRDSLKCARLALWCSVRQQMVSFSAARQSIGV